MNGIASTRTQTGFGLKFTKRSIDCILKATEQLDVIIAQRYRDLISAYLERSTPWRGQSESPRPRLYGLPVDFSPDPQKTLLGSD